MSLAAVAKPSSWNPAQPGDANSEPVTGVDGSALRIESLVEQSRAGCRESFERLVEHFASRIFHYHYQMTRSRPDAEDLTQVTFLKAYQNIRGFKSTHAFSGWLFTIAKRTALNHFRSARAAGELLADLEDTAAIPSVVLEQKDERSAIWQSARSLGPDQYEALWLRYGEGFSTAETARIMNTNLIRVRVLLHRARAILAKKMQRGDEGIPLTRPSEITNKIEPKSE